MTWLVVAMGVLLMLVGAVSVISGAPIIQIERGWAEVIAGSVAVSGGVITFALGIVLFRLQMWQQSAADRGLAQPIVTPTAILDPAADVLRPTRAPDDAVHIAPEPLPVPQLVEVEDDTAHPNLWRQIPAVAPVSIRPAVEPATALNEGVTAGRRTPEPGVAQPPALNLNGSDNDQPEPRPRRLTFPPSERPDAMDSRRPSTLSRDWMSRPLLRTRPPQPPMPEPPPLFAGPPADPDEDRAPAVQAHGGGPDEEPDDTAAPKLELAGPKEPQTPELSVVGRYQAGSSTYTMYSNGSIDVETQSGETHHFTSMDELKAFIARQENAVS